MKRLEHASNQQSFPLYFHSAVSVYQQLSQTATHFKRVYMRHFAILDAAYYKPKILTFLFGRMASPNPFCCWISSPPQWRFWSRDWRSFYESLALVKVPSVEGALLGWNAVLRKTPHKVNLIWTWFPLLKVRCPLLVQLKSTWKENPFWSIATTIFCAVNWFRNKRAKKLEK